MTSTIKPPTDAELLPCPFCGAPASGYAIEPHTHSGPLKALGIPDHCGSYVIEGACACGSGLVGETQVEVMERWNRRAPSPAGEPVLAPCDFCRRCGMAACSPNSNCEVEAECGRNNPAFIQPKAVREPLTEREMAEGWCKFQEQLELRMAADPGGLRSMGRDHWLSWAHWKAACFFARGITQKEGGQHADR